MDFEADASIERITRKQFDETFGIIVCALFHQPKPTHFANFYHELIQQLQNSFTDEEKHAVYLYPLAHLHVTIATLYNFKHPPPAAPDRCLQYWKERFAKLKEHSQNKPIRLQLDAIQLSKAAGYFQFKDENAAVIDLRRSIVETCVPEEGQAPLHVPNIVHTSFLRFAHKPAEPALFEEKFRRVCREVLAKTGEICLDVDEICLALESRCYMHIDCDESHILDTMKC